jgi:hypothetical protein
MNVKHKSHYNLSHICPVCGYDALDKLPYDIDGNASYEICSCYGFEYGINDDQGYSFKAIETNGLKKGWSGFTNQKKPISGLQKAVLKH